MDTKQFESLSYKSRQIGMSEVFKKNYGGYVSEKVPLEMVIGFMFSKTLVEGNRWVLLIRKNKPEWQKGKLNGVGGKVESDESPPHAMRREFEEEVGLNIEDWQYCLTLWLESELLHVFRCFGELEQANAQTDEPLIIQNVFNSSEVLHNVVWLIPLLLDDTMIFGPGNVLKGRSIWLGGTEKSKK